MKTNLLSAQKEMRQRMKRKPTPRGRKVGKVQSTGAIEASTRAQRRFTIFSLLNRGVSMPRTIMEVHRRFGVLYTPEWIEQWAESGYPLENQSTVAN
jgi:hypothetical protein